MNIDTNFVLSAYGREGIIRYFDKVLNDSKILYPANAQKNQLISRILRVQSSDQTTISGKYSISDNTKNVNNDLREAK